MKRKILRTVIPILALSILIGGCKKKEIKTLMDSPTEINIEEFSLVLEAYVYRDFMPTIGPEPNGMISINWLVDQNKNDISNRFDLMKQYVIKRNEIWETVYTDDTPESDNYKIERISRGGPTWETDKKVDVVCEFRDLTTEIKYKIKVEDVVIKRVE